MKRNVFFKKSFDNQHQLSSLWYFGLSQRSPPKARVELDCTEHVFKNILNSSTILIKTDMRNTRFVHNFSYFSATYVSKTLPNANSTVKQEVSFKISINNIKVSTSNCHTIFLYDFIQYATRCLCHFNTKKHSRSKTTYAQIRKVFLKDI